MDKDKKQLIELIIDKMKELEIILQKTYNAWGVEVIGQGGIDSVFSLGYEGIPMILDVEETDYLGDLFYDYTTGEISKAKYFKQLEKYLEEEK